MLTIVVKISNRVAILYLCGVASRDCAARITFSERFIAERNRENIYVIIYRKWVMGKVSKVARMAKEIRVVSENSAGTR